MNKFIYEIIFFIAIIFTIRNIKLMKQTKAESFYLDAYKAVVDNDEKAMEVIDKCINESKNLSDQKKAYVLKTIEEIKNDDDPSNSISNISIEDIFYSKGSFDMNKFFDNSDIFIWLIVAINKAYHKRHKKIGDELYEKIVSYEEIFKDCLEYKVFKGCYAILKGSGDYSFLKRLIDGEYDDVSYAKKTIGTFKRISELFLYFKGEALEEFYIDDLKDYATILLGNYLMNDLGVLSILEKEEK